MAKRFTTEEFIKKAKLIHGNDYDYSLVVYKNSYTHITLKCNRCENIWEQIPGNHLIGRGCPQCYFNSKLISNEEYVKRARELFGDSFEYITKYTRSDTKISIKCNTHNIIFSMLPHNHLAGQGCSECKSTKIIDKNTSNTPEFVIKAEKIHHNFYDYSQFIYLNNRTKGKIICPKHGVFEQTPNNHLAGSGCYRCGLSLLSSSFTKDTDFFIENAKEIHGNKYDYSASEYINARTKIVIICRKHGKFLQAPYNHLWGKGCPKCVYVVSSSEIEWLDYLDIPQKYRQQTIRIDDKYYRADAYDPDTKTIYEFYGDFWHGNPTKYKALRINVRNKKSFGELYQMTIDKENIFRAAGYNIISIWESDWNKIKNK